MQYQMTVHTCQYCGTMSNALICPRSRCLKLAANEAEARRAFDAFYAEYATEYGNRNDAWRAFKIISGMEA